jgi:hypothetical protein
MSLRSEKRTIFGIHSMTLYRESGEFFGTVECLEGSNLSLSGETIELTGGSSKYPFAVADGMISAEVSFTPSEYPDFLFEVLMGRKVTPIDGDLRRISPLVPGSENSSISEENLEVVEGEKENLKFGKYVIKALSNNRFKVFVSTHVDFGRGQIGHFKNDSLEIDLSSGAFGLSISLKQGRSLTEGDLGFFEVIPDQSQGMEVTIGGMSDVYPEFGAIVMAEKQGGKLFEIDVFRLKAVGLPIGLTKKSFANSEITAKAMFSSKRGGIAKIRAID